MRTQWSDVVIPLACMLFVGAALFPATETEAKRIRIYSTGGASYKPAQAARPAAAQTAAPTAPQESHAAAVERARRKLDAERDEAGPTPSAAVGGQVNTAGSLSCVAGCYGKP